MAIKRTKSDAHNDGRCEWNANGYRCCYPGTFSFSTLGSGPWYCRWHVSCDQETGANIVMQSQNYTPETRVDREKAFQAECDAYCQQVGMVRKDGESRDEFHARRMAWFREKLSSFLDRNVEKKVA